MAGTSAAATWDLRRCIEDLHAAIREMEDDRGAAIDALITRLAGIEALLIGPAFLGTEARWVLARELTEAQLELEAMR